MLLTELFNEFEKHNRSSKITSQFEDKNPLFGVIVFSNSSFNKDYSVESRSYVIRSDNKKFIQGQFGSSIFADNLDGTDKCVRLDQIMDECNWEIEDCYIQ